MLRGNYCAAWFPLNLLPALNHWRVMTSLQECRNWAAATVAEEWAAQYPKESGLQIASANRKFVKSPDIPRVCQLTDLRFADFRKS
jgi:hypothetical protein